MDLRDALLSMTPRTCRAAIHVNYTVILVFSVCSALFRMIEYLINIMFAAWIIHPGPLCLGEWMEIVSLHNNKCKDSFTFGSLQLKVKAKKDCVEINMDTSAGVLLGFFQPRVFLSCMR